VLLSPRAFFALREYLAELDGRSPAEARKFFSHHLMIREGARSPLHQTPPSKGGLFFPLADDSRWARRGFVVWGGVCVEGSLPPIIVVQTLAKSLNEDQFVQPTQSSYPFQLRRVVLRPGIEVLGHIFSPPLIFLLVSLFFIMLIPNPSSSFPPDSCGLGS